MRKKRFGKIIAIRRAGINPYQQAVWFCRCDCGGTKVVSQTHLQQGLVKSCGCLRKKHGESKTPLFNVWSGMLKRCRLKSRKDYHRYGGRGIKVCGRWHEYSNFRADMKVAYDRHRRRYSTTILERLDNNLGYFPENCTWVTAKESARNRRSTRFILVGRKRRTLTEWAVLTNTPVETIKTRLDRLGWSPREAVFGRNEPIVL